MSHDPDNKMTVNYYGYRRACTVCGWARWFNVEPTFEQELFMQMRHDVESPECGVEYEEVDWDDEM